MIQDPHGVLGVSKDATQDEIKKAYRKKAKQYHPDLHPDDPSAVSKMNELNEAYDMLMNPEKYKTAQSGGQRTYTGGGYGYGSYGTSINPTPEPGDSPEIRQAIDSINTGYFQSSLDILSAIPGIQRNARWYYLFSLAHYGLGNTVQAIDGMQKAAEMEPGNPTYRQLLQYFGRGQYTYAQNAKGYHEKVTNMQRLCFGCLLFHCFCGRFRC